MRTTNSVFDTHVEFSVQEMIELGMSALVNRNILYDAKMLETIFNVSPEDLKVAIFVGDALNRFTSMTCYSNH